MQETHSVATKTIRDLDENTYQKFRGICEEKKMKTGEAITEAIELWIRAVRGSGN